MRPLSLFQLGGAAVDWIDLHSFITVAREKSISKASQKLHLTQPTLTTRLKKLEQELGIPLLERNWEGVKLTGHGSIFLVHAMKLAQEMDEMIGMVDKLRSVPAQPAFAADGKLRIALGRPLSSTVLGPIFIELNKSNPSLRFEVISTYTNVILQLLELGQIHLGIASYFDHRPGYEAIPVFRETMILLAPHQDPEPIRDDLSNMQLLRKKRFILLHPHHAYLPLRASTDRLLVDLLGAMPEDIQDVHNIVTLKSMVASGLGYAVLPTSFLVNAEQPDRLDYPLSPAARPRTDPTPFRTIGLGERIPPRTIYLVYASDAPFRNPVERIALQISSVFACPGAGLPSDPYPH